MFDSNQVPDTVNITVFVEFYSDDGSDTSRKTSPYSLALNISKGDKRILEAKGYDFINILDLDLEGSSYKPEHTKKGKEPAVPYENEPYNFVLTCSLEESYDYLLVSG